MFVDFAQINLVANKNMSYFLLGLQPGAPMEEVEKRYKELRVLTHPDRGGSEADFVRIAKAYEEIKAAHSVSGISGAGVSSNSSNFLHVVDDFGGVPLDEAFNWRASTMFEGCNVQPHPSELGGPRIPIPEVKSGFRKVWMDSRPVPSTTPTTISHAIGARQPVVDDFLKNCISDEDSACHDTFAQRTDTERDDRKHSVEKRSHTDGCKSVNVPSVVSASETSGASQTSDASDVFASETSDASGAYEASEASDEFIESESKASWEGRSIPFSVCRTCAVSSCDIKHTCFIDGETTKVLSFKRKIEGKLNGHVNVKLKLDNDDVGTTLVFLKLGDDVDGVCGNLIVAIENLHRFTTVCISLATAISGRPFRLLSHLVHYPKIIEDGDVLVLPNGASTRKDSKSKESKGDLVVKFSVVRPTKPQVYEPVDAKHSLKPLKPLKLVAASASQLESAAKFC